MFGLDAGALEQKGQLLEAFLEAMGSKARKWLSRRDVPTSRRPHVTTFQHHDVGSTNAEVNNLKRRDASTSRRLNVVTLQRRDVNSRSAPQHLKYEWLINKGIERRTNGGTEFQSRVTQSSKKCPGFVLFLILVGY